MAESDVSDGTTPTAEGLAAERGTPLLDSSEEANSGDAESGALPHDPIPESFNETHSAFVRMLYPELVAEIFSLCVSQSWAPYCHKHKQQGNGRAARGGVQPLSLAAVCRSWQRVAMGCPPLWTTLLLTFRPGGENPEGKMEEQLDHLNQQVSRAGTSLLLSIRLEQRGKNSVEDEGSDIYDPVISFLNSYADRWREIDCRLEEEFYPLLMSKTQSYPRLTSLSIKSAGVIPIPILDLRNSAPSLTRIFLSRLYLRRICLPQPPLGLVKLDLKQFYPDECLVAIGYCANTLVHLCLRSVADGDDNHPIPTKPIIAPRVQTCDIFVASQGWVSIPGLLEHLVCPNIRRFRYTETRGLSRDGGLAALQFFADCLGPSYQQLPTSQDLGLVGDHHGDNASLRNHHIHRHLHHHHGVLAIIHSPLLTEEDLFWPWSTRSDVTVFGFLREPVESSRPFLDVEVENLGLGGNGRVPSFSIDAKTVTSLGSYWRDYLGSAQYLLPALDGR